MSADSEKIQKIKYFLRLSNDALIQRKESGNLHALSQVKYQKIPLSYKFTLGFLFDKLETSEPQYDELMSEYHDIINRIKTLDEMHEETYQEQLISEVVNSIDSFPKNFVYFADIEGWTQEADHALHIRDGLEFMLMELRQKRDVKELDRKVTYLDIGFKCLYLNEIETIMGLNLPFEILYYPDNFWWRHPSKILAEKQARLKQQVE